MPAHTRPHLASLRSGAALVVAAASLAAGCANFSGAARSDFDGALLNTTWYGAYYRPLPEADGTASARPAAAVAAATPAPRPAAAPAPAAVAAAPAPAAVAAAPAPPPAPAPAAAPVAASAARPPAPGGSTGGNAEYQAELAAAYVAAVYTLNETPVGSNASSIVDIYRHVQNNGQIYHTSRPAAGDLVFFHNTVDRNNDGRNNDWYTHVGIVEDVAADGTVAVLSYVSGSVSRLQLNLEHPSIGGEGADTKNSTLRTRRAQDPEHTQYLASELFAGFGSLLGDRAEVLVLDTWSPSQGDLASR